MKELNEYKQEIFRRSEQKKRQLRKRRRIVIGVVTPLCLCCVLTVVLFPRSMRKGDFAVSVESAADAEIEMLQTFRITDPTDAALALSILEGKDPDYSLNRDPVMQEDQLADQTEPGMYLLTLCKPDGSQLHYRIDGREVFCQTTAEAFSLTDQQANCLYEFLTQLSEEN
jgi:hypothetical protein